VPSQQGVGRHQAGKPFRPRAFQPFGVAGQPSPLLIIEAGLFVQQIFENADFFLQVNAPGILKPNAAPPAATFTLSGICMVRFNVLASP
jgi:hypothetical protein